MKLGFFICSLLSLTVHAQLLTYKQLVDAPQEYIKKKVLFIYTYRGMREKMPQILVNRGLSDHRYAILQANLKLTLLVKKNQTAWRNLLRLKKNTAIAIKEKVKHWSTSWGQKAYYIEIFNANVYSKEKYGKPSSKKPTSSPKKKTTLGHITKNHKLYLGKKVKFTMLFTGTQKPFLPQFNKFVKLKSRGHIGVFFCKK